MEVALPGMLRGDMLFVVGYFNSHPSWSPGVIFAISMGFGPVPCVVENP